MNKFKEELPNEYSSWSFAEELQKSIQNREWQKKEGLWTFLSAACDTAARECYEKINRFAPSLIDVDTCSIDALISISKSCGMDYLTESIPSNLPSEVYELMSRLSVPKRILLADTSDGDSLTGKVAIRASGVSTRRIPLTILKEIKNNVVHLSKIIDMNMIFVKTKLPSGERISDVLKTISEIADSDLSSYTENTDGENPFFKIAQVFKDHLHNTEYDFYIEPSYFDSENNTNVDLKFLISFLVNVIASDDELYFSDFLAFHFAELIRSKLQASALQELFQWDFRRKQFTVIGSKNDTLTADEFQKAVEPYVNSEQLEEFLNNSGISLESVKIYPLVQFIEYLRLINDKNSDAVPWSELLPVLFPDRFPNKVKIEEYISSTANWLSEEARRICTMRERIKISIQQLNLIGTKRIATDILTDFFIDNYPRLNGKTTSELLEKGFEIDITNYSDNTDYTNILASAGTVKIGQKVIGQDETVKYSIDNDGLITSSLVSSDIYEDIMADRTSTMSGVNERFWENGDMPVDFTPYKQFLSEDRKDLDNKSLSAFFGRVWDAFALSGYSENESGNGMRDKFIRNPTGKRTRYENNSATYFPTVAVLQNNKNLIEEKEKDTLNIMDVAVGFFVSLFEEIEQIFDEAGVPDEGWRNGLTIFHGYTTAYESAEKEDKTKFFDGPFEYSILQDLKFTKELCGVISKEYITGFIGEQDDNNFLLNTFYDTLNKNEFGEIDKFVNEDIIKTEIDEDENVFTLVQLKGLETSYDKRRDTFL